MIAYITVDHVNIGIMTGIVKLSLGDEVLLKSYKLKAWLIILCFTFNHSISYDQLKHVERKAMDEWKDNFQKATTEILRVAFDDGKNVVVMHYSKHFVFI